MCSERSPAAAIRIAGLGKRYEIYSRPKDRLKQMIMPRLKRMIGMHPPEYFREFWALRGIDFTVWQGETVAIIGSNGSGKSTLLQLICGTLHPTEGEVGVTGRIAALLELGAGFNPEFTGEENIYLSGMVYGIDEATLTERFDSIVAFAEIGEFIAQPVKTYSSGMYVRLAFAIAAHVDADVLVIDEALSVGDVRFTQKCMRFLRAFQQKGTVLFVSHDTSAVTSLCSRAIWLDHGALKMDSSAKETVEAYLAQQHALDRRARGETVAVAAVTGKPDRPDRPARSETVSDTAGADEADPRWEALRAQGRGVRMEVFEFDSDHVGNDFGTRGATVVNVELHGENGRRLDLVHGGEIVELKIGAKLHVPLENIILGFYLKDRLGQRLFGDNTFLSTQDRTVCAEAGQCCSAVFRFRMPILPAGTYSIDAAIASGTQDDHTQQHWVHDALALRAVESSMRHGLVGIPMLGITVFKEG